MEGGSDSQCGSRFSAARIRRNSYVDSLCGSPRNGVLVDSGSSRHICCGDSWCKVPGMAVWRDSGFAKVDGDSRRWSPRN
eukprot:7574945-Pyramimonas_sp.AAC.1